MLLLNCVVVEPTTTCTVVYAANIDALKVERVVGSQNCAQMIAAEQPVHLYV
jgi:hypothetical protein